MDINQLKKLLRDFKSGKIKTKEALSQLKALPYEDLGFAKIDSHRALRRGFPEVIFCQGKTIEQIVKIIDKMVEGESTVLATRASREVYEAVAGRHKNAIYNEMARTIMIEKKKAKFNRGTILVVCAGTSDIPVAEEAAVTAEIMGNRVERLYDVGISGIHRLFDQREKILKAKVIIVVAGMEGALASVIGGLVDKPVIAVPTSVGYGASFQGVAALLGMLNSCASGVAVVNIDNGFGAGYFASLINKSGS